MERRIIFCDVCRITVRVTSDFTGWISFDVLTHEIDAHNVRIERKWDVCPECWRRLHADPEHPGVFMWAEPATSTLPSGPLTPLPNLPKISETPHTPTTHGCERFVTGKAADDTGNA